MGLSWRQGRKHGSLLKKLGIQLENEKSVRELSKEIVSDFVKVEKRLFVREEMSEYEVPYGSAADLPIASTAKRNARHNTVVVAIAAV